MHFIFFFIHLWFVIRIFVRKLEHLNDQKIFDTGALTKIGTIFGVYIVIIVNISTENPVFLNLLLLHLPFVLLITFEALVRRLRANHFEKSFCCFLSNIILYLHAGSSFREAFKKSNRLNPKSLQKKYDEILNFVVFSQQDAHLSRDEFVVFVSRELRDIERSGHRPSERLAQLRELLEMEQNFRRKSGQVLRQARLQALIVGLLYAGVVAFMSLNFGFSQVDHYFLASLLPFAVGMLWIFQIGRRIRWPV